MTEHTASPGFSNADLAAHDEEARRRSLDPARSFIVQAPAGSGKTELLIQRFLSLLATVQAPEEIIAVTFTRKAAAEMRVRILNALNAADGDPPEQPHALRAWELARSVLKHDADMGWELREQPSRFRIMTIDALNGWITRQMPWISGMGAQPAIADDAAELYREAVRSVLLESQPDTRTARELQNVLVHLDNRYAAIEELFVDMLRIRDQWTHLLDVPEKMPLRARDVIERSLRGIIEEQLMEVEAALSIAQRRDIAELVCHAAATLSADSELPDSNPLRACEGIVDIPAPNAEQLPVWLGIVQLFLTSGDELRKPRGINRKLGFLPGDPMKQRLQEMLTSMQEDARHWGDLFGGIRRLPAPGFHEAQWEVLGSILHLLRLCSDALQRIFSRRATVDHAAVADAAIHALGSDLAPTELAMMLEYRIRHVLVDEFQDTSSAQFRLIELLTAGWSATDAHSLFLVGDPMQSIYRFREAEVGLFLRVWKQQRIGSVPMIPLRLHRNFRSQGAIVTWVNETFAELMPQNDDTHTGAVQYVHSEPVRAAEPEGVRFIPVFGHDREAEAAEAAPVIHAAVDGTLCGPVESVGVLVRSRRHLQHLVPRLRAEGVAFQAVEIEELGRHPAVLDVMALTRALTHEADRTAWLAVLRAPWCGAALADIHALCADGEQGTVRSALADAAQRKRCSPWAQRRFARIHGVMEEMLRRRGRTSLRRLAEGCWIALGGPATVDAEGYEAAMTYFTMLEECDAGGDLEDIRNLADHVAALYAPPDPGATTAVQLMTVHKAKGLQFDVVIVPRLDGAPRADQDRLLLWLERTGERGVDFILTPVRERGGEHEATYAYVRRVLAEKAEHEYRRLLYVAATRARRRLFLTASVGIQEKDDQIELRNPHRQSFLGFLWPIVEEDIHERFDAWRTHAAQELQSGAVEESAPMLRRVREDWHIPEPPPSAAFRPARERQSRGREQHRASIWTGGEEARVTGTVVHRILERIGDEQTAWWTSRDQEEQTRLLRTLFRQEGWPDMADRRVTQAREAVDRMLVDPRGQWILHAHESAEQELAIRGRTDEGTEMVILDRTFVDEKGVRWIIDYKTSEHEGSGRESFLEDQAALHRDRLLRYARFMQALDPRPIRLALYFPLLSEFREISSDADPDSPHTA